MFNFKQGQSSLSLCIMALLVAISGCGARDNKGPPDNNNPQDAKGPPNINGITFEMPWQVSVVEAIKAAQNPKGRITLTNDKHKLEVIDSHVNYNGNDYGPVKQGDSVKLTADGVVSINGQERKPQDTMP